MIHRTTIAGLNHVLRQQAWPLARLQSFAGRTITLRMPPLPDLLLRIGEEGLLDALPAAMAGNAADLTITLKPAALPRLLQRDEAAMRDIELTGAADLAQLAQQLFRELSWDVEDDLSRIVGDVLAHRIATTSRDFLAWQQEASHRLARNLADYWTEEQPVLARRQAVAEFGTGVQQVGDQVDALERRIGNLANRKQR